MSTPIAVSALERRFGDTVALAGISFEVAPGELFGIVGPDGAGKTTTLRILAGVLRPTNGDATIDGVSVSADPETVKSRTAYMPQRFGLYEDLTVLENLDFYADLYRVPRRDRAARYQRLFAFSNLGPFRDRLAGQLSGGMKQKLSLSCALVHHPALLLLDEPTFGVDPISRRDLWLILHEMIGQGVTIVVTTSYMDEAERCDRVALLDHGRILALDAPAALRGRVGGTMLAVHATPARAARDALRTRADVRAATLFGDRLHVLLDDRRAWAAAAAALGASGITVGDVRPVDATLEDVFIELVTTAG